MVVKLSSLFGTETDEYEVASKFKQLFEQDARLRDDPANEIIIVPNVQCHGRTTQDVDIVILARLENYSEQVNTEVYPENDEISLRTVQFRNFCCAVEVKSHDPSGVMVEGTNLYVDYGGKKKNVSSQNEQQARSLKSYLQKIHGTQKIWVSNAVYLSNVQKRDLSVPPSMPVLYGDMVLNDFFQMLVQKRKPSRAGEKFVYSDKALGFHFPLYIDLLTKQVEGTRLDRLKLEAICREDIIENQEYYQNIGRQFLVFKGRGGTGKTYRLLNLAYKLYNERDNRVLILTYNHSLIADLRRLFAILKIGRGLEHTIKIQSIYSYWYTVFHRVGLLDSENMTRNFKEEKLQTLLSSALALKLGPIRFMDLRRDHPEVFDWDFVLVDEAQDWSDGERDFLYSLFSPERIVIADGYDQLVRSSRSCNWSGSPTVNKKQVVSLKKSLRQKKNLVQFVRGISAKLGRGPIELDEKEDLRGGNVKIVLGDYTREIHEELLRQNKQDLNENVDMLFCVPPSYVSKAEGSSVGRTFQEWGYPVWDATIESVREETFPQSVDDIRIVQYDSCRGLEGWYTVNFALDRFFDYKFEMYVDEGQVTLSSEEERRIEFAYNWLLIVFTRAIDNLVIHIENPSSYLGSLLLSYAREHEDYVTVVNTQETPLVKREN